MKNYSVINLTKEWCLSRFIEISDRPSNLLNYQNFHV